MKVFYSRKEVRSLQNFSTTTHEMWVEDVVREGENYSSTFNRLKAGVDAEMTKILLEISSPADSKLLVLKDIKSLFQSLDVKKVKSVLSENQCEIKDIKLQSLDKLLKLRESLKKEVI